jgi:hypothetical protein
VLVRHRLLLLPPAAALLALSGCASVPAAAPAPANPGSAKPAATDPGSAKPAASDPVATKTASADDCPSAQELEKLVELPKGWHFGSVECSQGWAGADPEGPEAGDGVYLFHFKEGAGWRYYGEGSGYDCKDLKIEEPAPFCIS